jgi:positive regulator of sigma E activity
MIEDGIVKRLDHGLASVEVPGENAPRCGEEGCSGCGTAVVNGRTLEVSNSLRARVCDCVTIEESGMARLGRPLIIFGAPLLLAVAGAAVLGGSDARTGLGLVLGLGTGVGLALWVSHLLARRHLFEPHMVSVARRAERSCCDGGDERR